MWHALCADKRAQAGAPAANAAGLLYRCRMVLDHRLAGQRISCRGAAGRTLCRLKQLPTAHQAAGDRRSRATARCARCANSTSRLRCHSTVEYTSRPCKAESQVCCTSVAVLKAQLNLPVQVLRRRGVRLRPCGAAVTAPVVHCSGGVLLPQLTSHSVVCAALPSSPPLQLRCSLTVADTTAVPTV